jgi:exopolysaccharide biosynthesis WecB/TagA/CpsF family protein
MIDLGKRDVLGVGVDVVDYEAAADRLLRAAHAGRSAAATAVAVHGVVTAARDPELRAMLNEFALVTPDGQPVRWALNLLHRADLQERVYGPDLTTKVAARAAEQSLPVYIYGSSPEVLDRFVPALRTAAPGLAIAGREPSSFRAADRAEIEALADRIRASGARLVLVGLGCPRQEVFTYALTRVLALPVLAVGAAFDYHAGNLRKPPPWMQDRGLEWLWRLGLEPKRLWRRYLLLNPLYLTLLAGQRLGLWRPAPVAGGPAWPREVPS